MMAIFFNFAKCLFLSFLALLTLVFFYDCQANAQDVSTILTGKVITTVSRGVTVPFNGIVEDVLVKPGDAVEEGTPLMRYKLQDDARRQLQRELTNGSGTENLKGQVLDLERELASANAERNKTRQLVSSGLGSRQALSRLEENVSAIKSRIELLKSTIKKTESIFQERLQELSDYFGQPVKEGSQLPNELILASPIKGYVLSISPELNPGQLIGAGMAAIQVGQLNPVLIQIPVYEAEINNIHVGDSAIVEIPSLNNRQFKGIVSEISWISNDMNVASPSYYTVEVTVPNPDLLLKPGFKAVVRFSNSTHRK